MARLRKQYRAIASQAANEGFSHHMSEHLATHFQRSDRLIVTFDNMKSRKLPGDRTPWAYNYVKARGASHLSVMMVEVNDWFRHRDVADMFDRLRDGGFFKRFRDVVFYGSSMGGYGALAYCSAAPGARVVVSTPQSSLDPVLVPWETRYDEGRDRGEWSGRYLDGAMEAKTASEVFVLYDPYHEPDERHVARLSGPNIVRLRCPWMEHKILTRLGYMELLKPTIDKAIAGEIDEEEFTRMFRERRANKSRTRTVLRRALNQGHPKLVGRALADMKASNPNWKFPQLQKEVKQRAKTAIS